MLIEILPDNSDILRARVNGLEAVADKPVGGKILCPGFNPIQIKKNFTLFKLRGGPQAGERIFDEGSLRAKISFRADNPPSAGW